MAVVATLRPSEANVDPGASTSFQLTVRNTGSVVDEFTFAVVGDAAPWSTITPDRVSLFPGTEGTVQVQFAPARAASVTAGTTPFGVRVISREAPASSTVEEALLTVGTFSALTADLSPRTVRAAVYGSYRVRIANDGNTPVAVTLKGRDPDELLSIQFENSTRTIEPGGTTSARVRARARKPFWFGPVETHPFQVTVEAPGTAPVVLDGNLSQLPRLPAAMPRIAGGAIALAVIAGVLVFVSRQNDTPATTTVTTAAGQTTLPGETSTTTSTTTSSTTTTSTSTSTTTTSTTTTTFPVPRD